MGRRLGLDSRFTQALCSDGKYHSHNTYGWLQEAHPFWHKGKVSIKYRHYKETSVNDRGTQKTVTGFMFDFAIFHLFRDGEHLRYVDGPSAPKYFFAIPDSKNYEWLPNTQEHKDAFMYTLNEYSQVMPEWWQVLVMREVPRGQRFNPLKSATAEDHGTAFELWAAKVLRYGGMTQDDARRIYDPSAEDMMYADALDNRLNRWTLPKRELPQLPDKSNATYEW